MGGAAGVGGGIRGRPMIGRAHPAQRRSCPSATAPVGLTLVGVGGRRLKPLATHPHGDLRGQRLAALVAQALRCGGRAAGAACVRGGPPAAALHQSRCRPVQQQAQQSSAAAQGRPSASPAAHVAGGEDVGGADERAGAARAGGLVHAPQHECGVGEEGELLVCVAVDNPHLLARIVLHGCVSDGGCTRHAPPAAGGRRVQQRCRLGGGRGRVGQGAGGQAHAVCRGCGGVFQDAACRRMGPGGAGAEWVGRPAAACKAAGRWRAGWPNAVPAVACSSLITSPCSPSELGRAAASRRAQSSKCRWAAILVCRCGVGLGACK